MSAANIFFMAIGFGLCLWWLTGVVIFTFLSKVYVQPGAPLMVKIKTVVLVGFTMPYVVMVTGHLPMVVIATPEHQAEVDRWMRDTCPCDDCRRRRGEIA